MLVWLVARELERLILPTNLLIKINKDTMNTRWLVNKTKGVNIFGKYLFQEEIDKKIIIFDFSGNEVYR